MALRAQDGPYRTAREDRDRRIAAIDI